MKKFKKTISVLVLILLIISLSTCKKMQKIAKTPEMGNTNGNIVNFGLVASQCDWLYISILSKDSGKLIKMRSDGTEKTKLNDDKCSFLNVVGGWIYYKNDSDYGSLYKVRTNGSKKTKMDTNDCFNIIVIGDWIYFDTENGLYKIGIDGSKKTFINNDVGRLYVNILGEWLYCTDKEGIVYKIKTDGSERIQWGGDGCFNLIVSGNWIYYCNFKDDLNLFKSPLDVFGENLLSKDRVLDLNIAGDWLYYCNLSDAFSLYKIKTDGTSRTKIAEDRVSQINIIGDWIFYKNRSDQYALYKIKTDGTGRERVEEKPVDKKIYTEEDLFYTYGVWISAKPSDYVYEYPTNKSSWVKDPYKDLLSYKGKNRVGRYYLDINQDDIPELFLSWSGGTGGGNYVVYQITMGDYRFLGNLDFFPSPQILPTKHNGFSDLIIFSRLGGNEIGEAEGILSMLEFDGTKYKEKKKMNIIMEEAIQKKIFAPNTDKIFSHNYIADDDKEPSKPWTIKDDDKYRKLIK